MRYRATVLGVLAMILILPLPASRLAMARFACVMIMDDSALFTKLLVARHSPKNGCHAQDGEVLIVRPKTPRPSKDASHHFVSAKDRRTKSKFGWVQEVAPFTLQDFITTHLADRKLSEEEREHLQSMLTATARIPVDKPATVDYVIRGVEHRVVVLNVHRVIFYYPKPKNQQA